MSHKSARWLLLMAIALTLSRAAVPPGNPFISANQQYSVELSRTPENKILVAVFNVSKEPKTLHWSRQIGWQDPHPFWAGPGTAVTEVKALVTNDGATVVLRDDGSSQQLNNVRILRRAEDQDYTVRPFDRRELTGPISSAPSPSGMRPGTSYLYVAAILDMIFDEEGSYAIWFGQTDQWLFISLKDRKQAVVKDAGMIDRLNDLARRKAVELVLQHQPPPLRKMLSALKEQVARIIPSARTPSFPRYMIGDTTAAYLFLTARRNAADKSFIEGLLNYPAQGTQQGYPMLYEGLKIDCSVTHSERLVGDFLLDRWNGETNREVTTWKTYLLLPHDSFRHLGTFKIDLALPMPMPSTNAGILWAYAIPGRVPSDKWQESSEVLAFNTYLSQSDRIRAYSSIRFGPEVQAIFRGLTPGDYRFKLIWERNPPARTWRTNFYSAVPGDYESVVTKPITVKAGETVENISLTCTNRLGTAEAYESDERLAKEQTPTERKPTSKH